MIDYPKKRSFGYQSCRFRSGNNGRRRRRIGGREDSCPSPGRILHRAHREDALGAGKDTNAIHEAFHVAMSI